MASGVVSTQMVHLAPGLCKTPSHRAAQGLPWAPGARRSSARRKTERHFMQRRGNPTEARMPRYDYGPSRFAVRAAGVTEAGTSAPWWSQRKDLWVEIDGQQDFFDLVEETGKSGKLLFIDFYATWCHACQKVYPIICERAEDPELQSKYVFAKCQVDKHKSLVKQLGLSVLPVAQCYGPGGKLIFQAGVSPLKVKNLERNLKMVLEDPTLVYTQDSSGLLSPETPEMREKRQQEDEERKQLEEERAALAAKRDSKLASVLSGDSPKQSSAGNGNNKSPDWDPRKAKFMWKYKGEYGYGGKIDELYEREVGSRLQPNEHYMDYTAASLYCNSQIDAVMDELKGAVFGNPHSPAPSSVLTDTKVEAVRERILKFFNADPAEYQCVFTRSATDSLKMVGETFPWSAGSKFVYLRENHNSVLGQRAYALRDGGSFQAVDEDWVEAWITGSEETFDEGDDDSSSPFEGLNLGGPLYNLFAFPGEDNFAGVKYPLEWIRKVQAKSTDKSIYKVMLDAAAFVPSNPLDLSEYPADYVAVSFYKMFGYPTGLGALLVRTENVELMDKVFWGGGSVALATSDNDFHVLKCKPSERLEDGTIAFLDIIALNHGFNLLDSLGGIGRVQAHVASLSEFMYHELSTMTHDNGKPMALIFGKHSQADSRKVQGGIVNFELLGEDGNPLSYIEFQEAAGRAGFHIRTGAECNPGACYKNLGVQDKEVEGLAGLKEGCNDEVEYIRVQRTADFTSLGELMTSIEIMDAIQDTKVPLGHIGEVAMKWIKVPLGSIRVSLGYMSTYEDVRALLDWIAKRYKNKNNKAF